MYDMCTLILGFIMSRWIYQRWRSRGLLGLGIIDHGSDSLSACNSFPLNRDYIYLITLCIWRKDLLFFVLLSYQSWNKVARFEEDRHNQEQNPAFCLFEAF